MIRVLERKIPPLLLSVAFAAAIVALARYVPAANVPFPGHRVVAVVAWGVGFAIAIVGLVQFGLARTTIHPLHPHEAKVLVITGVYRLTRNPMYLGVAGSLAGLAAWRSTLLGYALVPVFCIALTELQIKAEERALLEKFGDEFHAYAAKVRRWI